MNLAYLSTHSTLKMSFWYGLESGLLGLGLTVLLVLFLNFIQYRPVFRCTVLSLTYASCNDLTSMSNYHWLMRVPSLFFTEWESSAHLFYCFRKPIANVAASSTRAGFHMEVLEKIKQVCRQTEKHSHPHRSSRFIREMIWSSSQSRLMQPSASSSPYWIPHISCNSMPL